MKFIHAADIHLDSPLHGLSAYPDAPAELLRNASRDALVKLVDHAIEEDVDFMVIAGDLYDGDWRDHNTGIFFSQQLGRLRRACVPVFLLYGNHDAESEMTKKLTLPDNVSVFGARKPEVFRLDDLKVALHGQSFRTKAVVDNLVLGYPEPVPGYYNIGVLHTALEGSSTHANYAPCSRAELHARGYDYWALGHVHEFQQWDEQSVIVFPGNLQGRHIRETGRRGAVLVTVDQGHTQVERLFIDVLRWEALDLDVSGCTSMADIARQTGAALENLLSIDEHVPRAVRVTLRGRSAMHGPLFGNAQTLHAEVRSQIAVLGNDKVWLEKVKVATEPLEDALALHSRFDAIADLQAILADAADDPDFLAALQSELQPFFGRVVADVNNDVPLLSLARAGDFADLVNQVSPALLARLAEGE
ncbi:DNA repair exonuclease [Pusillimonas sp. ANT_WB101]|uniref:metallophosphoesterase family protein n=1 Tax=Pusillimonas sp. ANT_WB101 TaxID=2597356 RepID=UPI0011ECC9C5|nr:DNA repair exonuclease [Pusillimonas sp. ANT_WB101]KAA0911241.1 DNA repair exonuclease [Pusillimonas sp. ANT_WB101]